MALKGHGKTTAAGYGHAYQLARALLLRDNPRCHWCGEPATQADHDPPLSECAEPHLNLVPACLKCNQGRRGKVPWEPSREW